MDEVQIITSNISSNTSNVDQKSSWNARAAGLSYHRSAIFFCKYSRSYWIHRRLILL